MITVVLPAYNEASRLENCVRAVKRSLKNNYEIIIAEDGSTDGTDKIATEISRKDRHIKLMQYPRKLGRGLALKKAFKNAKGNIMCYLDVDLATDMKYFPQLIDYAKNFDVVCGSRYMSGSSLQRPALRDAISRFYNSFVRYIIGCDVHDTQIGFKAFSKKFVENEIMSIDEKSWAWDTIVVVNACKKGYKVKEFPVKWIEKKGKKTSISRLLADMRIHGRVLAKLFLKWNLGLDVRL